MTPKKFIGWYAKNRAGKNAMQKSLNEKETQMLAQLTALPGYLTPFHAMDNPLVETLVNIIRYQQAKLELLTKQ